MRRAEGFFEKERVLPLFLLLFGLVFLRYCYYGLVYFPQLDDYIQLHNHSAYYSATQVILDQGLLSSRPLASVGDYFFWSAFWGRMIGAVAILSALYAASALLFRRVWSVYFGTGYIFLAVYALLPLGMEGTYWVSAANRIVPSLFFTALAMWLFQRWCQKGKAGVLALYAITQLVSYLFYEQGLVLSVTGVLLVGILEFKGQKKRSLFALITFVNAAVYFAFTGYFSTGSGQLGGRMKLLLPWQSGWDEVVESVLTQLRQVFLSGGWKTLARGFRRGLAVILVDPNPLWILLVLALCGVFFLAVKGSEVKGAGTLWALVVGFLFALAPITIFFVLERSAVALRAAVFSFCGLALIADAVFNLLFGKWAWRSALAGVLCAAFALVASIAAVSELHDYRQTYLEDQRAGAAVIAALNGGLLLQPWSKVAVLNLEGSYLKEQNFAHLEHVAGATGSEWAFTGLLACESGNRDFPYTTPIPAGANVDLSRFDLLLYYDHQSGTASVYTP